MKKLKGIFSFFLLFNYYLYANFSEVHNKNDEKIKTLLEKNYTPFLINKASLQNYYELNKYKPFWTQNNELKESALTLLEKIKNDPVLKPNLEKAFKLNQVIQKLSSIDKSDEQHVQSMLKIDFMLTELFDKYIQYLSNGSINWKAFQVKLEELDKTKEIKGEWDRHTLKVDSYSLLKKALKDDDLSIIFENTDFNYPHSEKLIGAISELETILEEGDYVQLPEFQSLRVGDYSENVDILRKRLLQSKDLKHDCNDSSCKGLFDEDLKNAVISFQKSHGLYADGIVGKQTQVLLNMSAKKKISTIRLNLERMRWLPRDFGNKYIIVNIPEFRMRMIENENIKLNMAVIVGETKHPTPIFSNEMSYIVLNPNWNIPDSITKKEIIPKLLKDPNYLIAKGIDIYEGWQQDSLKLEATDMRDTFILNNIDSLPNFRFTQGPSDQNPLGRMKFMFPNKHAVYLHDTPGKNLFNNARRAYSHGCIRLSKPEELLYTIANEDIKVDKEKVDAILKETNEKSIGLGKKIPVHIVYLTSWVDEQGKLQFREDIYNYDKMQKELMF